jgi:hypothetical protein
MPYSRRGFVTTALTTLAALAAPIPAFAQRFLTPAPNNPKGRRTIYRLSSRGRRISNAAKAHNANMRFANRVVANTHRAHKGDHSRIVPLTVSIEEYHRLFTSRHSLVADLRALNNIKIVKQRR